MVSLVKVDNNIDINNTFQLRVKPWVTACFGSDFYMDKKERNHRFLEESIELVQSLGCSKEEALFILNYVYERDVGIPEQEVGGVMTTLAVLCMSNDMDMHKAGEKELSRIWEKIEQIRHKTSLKPKYNIQESNTIKSEVNDTIETHGLDTVDRVCFYEQDFYVLSNFSSFRVNWKNIDFDTSEHAYHWAKFPDNTFIRTSILKARSAHDAFKIGQEYKALRRTDWDEVKVDIMRSILYAKVNQHEYVKRKLMSTGERELVENSWRDDFWGWGPNKDGKNMLGTLWMEIRKELV